MNRQVAAFMRADFLVCIQSSDAVAFDVRFIMYPLFQLMELSPQRNLFFLQTLLGGGGGGGGREITKVVDLSLVSSVRYIVYKCHMENIGTELCHE